MGMNSDRTRNRNTAWNFSWTPRRVAAAAGAGVLAFGALSACGNGNAQGSSAAPTEASASATPGEASQAAATPAASRANTVSAAASIFTFNTLNGGYPDIKTYAGPGTSTNDRIVKARYTNGEQSSAICETPGRTVSSVAGEHPSRTTSEWVLLGDGYNSFATMTYGDLSGPTPPSCTPEQIAINQ